MGIFSRSKKEPTTSPPQPQPVACHPGSSSTHQANCGSQRVDPLQPPHGLPNGGSQFSGWIGTAPQPYPSPPYPPYQQVFVSNYLLPAPQPLKPHSGGKKSKTKVQSSSMIHLPQLGPNVPTFVPGAQVFNDGIPFWHQQGTQYLNQGAALYELISSKFNTVVTSIDEESFSGDETELWVNQAPSPPVQEAQLVSTSKQNAKERVKPKPKDENGGATSKKPSSTNYFAKVNLYANSRLPPNLPEVKLYIPTFPLLCLAAKYSEQVYTKPSGKERETYVDADWRLGTKSMVIKSVPIDDMNVIVFAIRGSQTFLDWAVNLNSAPAAPTGFLDDPGNFCHAGFLSVARKMIAPVAARLRNLIAEDPDRAAFSLLITGHSAGGAVAALLYSHMLASSPETESELNILTGYFKRIHCVTFGAPPVSLLPLTKPEGEPLKKSLFFSFVNEGDPVARADKAYVKSLLELYAAPAPTTTQTSPSSSPPQKHRPVFTGTKAASSSALTLTNPRPNGPSRSKSFPTTSSTGPIWPVPPSTLSNAGRLILLRSVRQRRPSGDKGTKKRGLLNADDRMDDGVQARIITDEQLRGVVWGDPVSHMMKLYTRRIEVLATNAVMGRG